jgi:hypothetical protein
MEEAYRSRGDNVYQPKIRDDLIPRLYRLAKALNIPMTRLVNHILEHGIVRVEEGAENVSEALATDYRRKARRKERSDGYTT